MRKLNFIFIIFFLLNCTNNSLVRNGDLVADFSKEKMVDIIYDMTFNQCC